MADWQPESTAPMDTAVLVYDGEDMAVAKKSLGFGGKPWWMIDNSYGFNEDGQIHGVTHWMHLPETPTPT